ncbi:MAG: hypothetical protein U0441_11785 [Polyangiaceae bacterium]
MRRALCSTGMLGVVAAIAIALAACGDRGSGGHAAGASAKDPGCYGCHVDDYKGAHRHEGQKPVRCEVCHGQEHWHPIQHNHEWQLTGAHEKADCFSCHTSKPPVFEGTSRACISCHRKEYDEENAKSPSHRTASETCDKCHSTNDWAEWPGHPKSDRRPPETPTPTVASPAPKPTVTATATASTTTKKPTPIPKPTTKPTGTPAPTPAPKPTQLPTLPDEPPIVTGPSRRH